ncbi:hypothetical protein D3C73_837220 [compost metagenome]
MFSDQEAFHTLDVRVFRLFHNAWHNGNPEAFFMISLQNLVAVHILHEFPGCFLVSRFGADAEPGTGGHDFGSSLDLAVKRWRQSPRPVDSCRELVLIYPRLRREGEVHADFACRELGAQRIDIQRFSARQNTAVFVHLLEIFNDLRVRSKIKLARL